VCRRIDSRVDIGIIDVGAERPIDKLACASTPWRRVSGHIGEIARPQHDACELDDVIGAIGSIEARFPAIDPPAGIAKLPRRPLSSVCETTCCSGGSEMSVLARIQGRVGLEQ